MLHLGINGPALFLDQEVRGKYLFCRLHDDDLACLAGCESIDDGLIFLEDGEFFPIVGVWGELYEELIHSLRVGFAIDQHHPPPNAVGLLLEPLPCVVQLSDS